MKTQWERITADQLIQIPEKDDLEPLMDLLQQLDYIYEFNEELKIKSQRLDND